MLLSTGAFFIQVEIAFDKTRHEFVTQEADFTSDRLQVLLLHPG